MENEESGRMREKRDREKSKEKTEGMGARATEGDRKREIESVCGREI